MKNYKYEDARGILTEMVADGDINPLAAMQVMDRLASITCPREFLKTCVDRKLRKSTTIFNVSRSLHDVLDYICAPDEFIAPAGIYSINGVVAHKVFDDWDSDKLEHYVKQIAYYVQHPDVLVGVKLPQIKRRSYKGSTEYNVTEPIIRHKNCLQWLVKGHLRRLQSGKLVFIKPHSKKWRNHDN